MQPLDEASVGGALRLILAGKRDLLVLDDLRVEDLEALAWSGGPGHVRAVARALERVAAGDQEYLVIRAPSGAPVAKLGIDYSAHPDAGTFWQFTTHPQLRSLGLGTRLIKEGERRIGRRGLRWAMLGVEDHNPRARALYERLGYVAWKREPASWLQEDKSGHFHLYETELAILRKQL